MLVTRSARAPFLATLAIPCLFLAVAPARAACPPQVWQGIETLDPPIAPDFWYTATFGYDAVAATREWAAVSHRSEATVHLYRRGVDGWEYSQSVRGPRSMDYGTSLAIEGQTLVVGIPAHGAPAVDSGRAWVYELIGDEWTKTATLRVPGLPSQSYFGRSVDIDGGVIVVGAPGVPSTQGQIRCGAVVVFERGASGWEHTVHRWEPAFPGLPNANMGHSVAIDGDTILAGAPGRDTHVYVYHRAQTGVWARAAVLADPTPAASSRYGWAVDIEGDVAVVGRPRFNHTGFAYHTGSAFLFRRDAATQSWSFEQEIEASDGFAGLDYGDQFGAHVAIAADRIVVGSTRADATSALNGKAYLFEVDPAGAWQEARRFVSPVAQHETGLTRSMFLTSEYLFAGLLSAPGTARLRVYAFEQQIGRVYCDGGGGNRLNAIGSTSVSRHELALVASELVPGSRNVFLFGTTPDHLPLWGGTLCVGPTPARIGPLMIATDSERLVLPLDFDAPVLAGLISVGSTLVFQQWTDGSAGGPFLSNAVGLTWTQ